MNLSQPADAYKILTTWTRKRQEHFIVMTLNGAHEVIRRRVVTIGTVNRTLIHPREVFYPAIKDNAVAIIVAHNHPSGNLDPSQEDRQVTRRLVEAGIVLGIPVLDHLVFSKKGFYSFSLNGEI